MIPLISSIAVALLTLIGPVVRGEVADRLYRRVRNHAGLRPHLGDGSVAMANLDTLLAAEVAALRDREVARLNRKLNGGNLAALIFVALVGGFGFYGLLSAAIAVAGGFWFWVLVVIAAAWGLFFVVFALVGATTLFQPPKPKVAKTSK